MLYCNIERGFERKRKKEECDFAGTYLSHFMLSNLIYFRFCFFYDIRDSKHYGLHKFTQQNSVTIYYAYKTQIWVC